MAINHPSYSPTNYGRWSVETGHGEAIGEGLAPEFARRLAQRMADERGTIYWAVGPNDSGDTIWLEHVPSEEV